MPHRRGGFQTRPYMINRISPYMINRISPYMINRISPYMINRISPYMINRISPYMINRISPYVANRISPYVVNRISPYVVNRIRFQNRDAVHMIGHDSPGVQVNMGIVLRQLFPYGLCQAAGRAKAQFAFCNVTEDTCPVPCADCDEIRARLAVIKPRQPYGLPTARHNVAESGGFGRPGSWVDLKGISHMCAR